MHLRSVPTHACRWVFGCVGVAFCTNACLLMDMVSMSFYRRTTMEMTEKEIHELARYIATYLAEENQHVDLFTVRDAIEAYLGGAR